VDLFSKNIQAESEIREERRMKTAIGAFCICLLVAVILSIQLSTLGLNFGSLVYGSPSLWRGHQAAFRVAAIDPQTTRFVRDVRAVITLDDQNGHAVQHGAVGSDFVEFNVDVPKDMVPVSSLFKVSLGTTLGNDNVTIPTTIVDRPTSTCTVRSHTEALNLEHATSLSKPARTLEIHLYPVGGQAVRTLENVIWGRLTRRGTPVATARIRGASHAFVLDTVSDANGLFRFSHQSYNHNEPLLFEIVGEETVAVPIEFRPAQQRVDLSPGPFLKPGTTLRAHITTLPFRGAVHVDFWTGDILAMASSAPAKRGQRLVEFDVPEDFSGLLQVEVYRGLFSANDGSTSVGAVWVGHSNAAAELQRCLAATQNIDPAIDAFVANPSSEKLATLALTRIVRENLGMPLLRSNMHERASQVTAEIETLRRKVHVFLGLTLLVGLGLAVSWITRHQIQVQRQLRAVFDEGENDGIRPVSALAHRYDLAMVVGVLMLAAYGIWMLVTRISWLTKF